MAKIEINQETDMLRKNWDAAGRIGKTGPADGEKGMKVDVDKAWMDLHGRLEREQLIPKHQSGHRIVRMRAFRVAAMVLLLMAVGTLAYVTISPSARGVQMSASTFDQQEFGLNLPDGSTVDLNAGSSINYKVQRSGTRTVTLEGEAFFDVAHDPDWPFIIRTGKAVIEVTGTSFTVRNDPEIDKIEVFVETGNVQFYRSRKQDRILSLKAGQLGVLEEDKLSIKKEIEPNILSWKTRKLSFRNTRLGDVAGVLNRTYSQQIRFTNEALEDCPFTGTFDQQPIDSVVRVIQLAYDLEIDRQGKAYVFSGEGCN